MTRLRKAGARPRLLSASLHARKQKSPKSVFDTLSGRARSNLAFLHENIRRPKRPKESLQPVINLSIAENWLLRTETIPIYNKAIQDNLQPTHLSYQDSLAGDTALRKSLSRFLNGHFDPFEGVEPDHIVVGPGATGCVDNLLYSICDVGEGVMIPAPYWNGLDFCLKFRCSLEPVVVNLAEPFDGFMFSDNFVPAFENALERANCKVRALLLTNPGNPVGCCYTRRSLEDLLLFCERHDLHLVVDEVYALTSFDSADICDPVPFTSILQLDAMSLGCDPSRIHMVWSTSKTFGSSGIRAGCVVSQSNQDVRMATSITIAQSPGTSVLSSIATKALLDSSQMPKLLIDQQAKLLASYNVLAEFLQRYRIEYIPASAGLFLMAKLCPKASTLMDELAVAAKLEEYGLVLGCGSNYHMGNASFGYFRITFAVPHERLKLGLCRLAMALDLEDSTALRMCYGATDLDKP